MTRFFLVHIVPIIIALCCTPVIVWALDDTVPFVYQKMAVQTPIVAPGGILRIAVYGTRTKICPLTINEEITDSKRTLFELEERAVMPSRLGELNAVFDVPIPVAIALGEATYNSEIWYMCNPWQKLISPLRIEREPVKFFVDDN